MEIRTGDKQEANKPSATDAANAVRSAVAALNAAIKSAADAGVFVTNLVVQPDFTNTKIASATVVFE